ncbi:MAG: tRNA (cytidine(34)-2'-O)-methyltransferase [Zetaproteobacteria bacterium]|nr:tRNA (cytidine(34)-2'-O)-methyltransferase [Zetaproteobacteria bacterium]
MKNSSTIIENQLHIVLFEPEIPPNTGNIARLCACTGCSLHLIHPLGFSINDKHLKRAGLDYWHHLDIHEYDNWSEFKSVVPVMDRCFGLSTKAVESIWNVQFQAGDMIVFGPESRGLPEYIRNEISLLKVPMLQHDSLRSLNLSSACSIVTYEALRQLNCA